ncbi:hypothetical protein HMPREF3190_00064 [Umbribacter vaginalis]|nr:hypothetical protein HMPREF3190_00064 [Coriobacteriales bacterium DNF00809]
MISLSRFNFAALIYWSQLSYILLFTPFLLLFYSFCCTQTLHYS